MLIIKLELSPIHFNLSDNDLMVQRLYQKSLRSEQMITLVNTSVLKLPVTANEPLQINHYLLKL